MNLNRSLVILGLLLLNISIRVQSAPVKGTSSSSINNEKKKINVQETSAYISDNVDKSDNSDINMNSNELINLRGKHRNTHGHLNKRHKRAFYEIDPLYESLFIKPQLLIRPTRSFMPLYWSPSSLERNIRLASESSFYEPSEWNRNYPNTIETDDIDVDRSPFYIDDYDDETNYEYNRYPISFEIPYDNLQLQQEYNTDDLPMDDDEEFISTRYDPFDDYFK